MTFKNPNIAESDICIYIGPISKTVTAQRLLQYFSEVVPVSFLSIPCDEKTNESLGYGYVYFANIENARKAIEKLNFTVIDGIAIRLIFNDPKYLDEDSKDVNFEDLEFEQEMDNLLTEEINSINDSEPKPVVTKPNIKIPGRNVFVKNLSKDVTENMLGTTFASFGRIDSVSIARDEFGNSKGFGFILYSNSEEAEKAIQSMHSRFWNNKKIYVAHHICKAQRISMQVVTAPEAVSFEQKSPEKFSTEKLSLENFSTEKRGNGIKIDLGEIGKEKDINEKIFEINQKMQNVQRRLDVQEEIKVEICDEIKFIRGEIEGIQRNQMLFHDHIESQLLRQNEKLDLLIERGGCLEEGKEMNNLGRNKQFGME